MNSPVQSSYLPTMDTRQKLLKLISLLAERQRVTLTSDAVFQLKAEDIDVLASGTDANPNWQMKETISIHYTGLECGYDYLKSRTESELLDVAFGLFKPVFNHMEQRHEIESGTHFQDFIFAVLSMPEDGPTNSNDSTAT